MHHGKTTNSEADPESIRRVYLCLLYISFCPSLAMQLYVLQR